MLVDVVAAQRLTSEKVHLVADIGKDYLFIDFELTREPRVLAEEEAPLCSTFPLIY